MKNAYKYYVNIIKPIEKKYTKMCIFYSLLKFNYFKNRMLLYNNILINYYTMLQKNPTILEELDKQINN